MRRGIELEGDVGGHLILLRDYSEIGLELVETVKSVTRLVASPNVFFRETVVENCLMPTDVVHAPFVELCMTWVTCEELSEDIGAERDQFVGSFILPSCGGFDIR